MRTLSLHAPCAPSGSVSCHSHSGFSTGCFQGGLQVLLVDLLPLVVFVCVTSGLPLVSWSGCSPFWSSSTARPHCSSTKATPGGPKNMRSFMAARPRSIAGRWHTSELERKEMRLPLNQEAHLLTAFSFPPSVGWLFKPPSPGSSLPHGCASGQKVPASCQLVFFLISEICRIFASSDVESFSLTNSVHFVSDSLPASFLHPGAVEPLCLPLHFP